MRPISQLLFVEGRNKWEEATLADAGSQSSVATGSVIAGTTTSGSDFRAVMVSVFAIFEIMYLLDYVLRILLNICWSTSKVFIVCFENKNFETKKT